MTTPHRRQRARATQRIAAEYLAKNGHPYAASTGASAPGTDVENVPGWDIEVKAARDGDRLAALRQSLRRPGEFHVVIERPDGYGPERVSEWPVSMSFGEWAQLIRLAGYGDPLSWEQTIRPRSSAKSPQGDA